jgi:hypothetical protein
VYNGMDNLKNQIGSKQKKRLAKEQDAKHPKGKGKKQKGEEEESDDDF